MEFLKQDLIRPVMKWLFPGAIFLGLTITILAVEHPSIGTQLSLNAASAIVVAAILSTGFGLIFDTLGAWYESQFIDWCLNRLSQGKHEKDWNKYLLCQTDGEIVAHRYYRDTYLSLKFELRAFFDQSGSYPHELK